MSLKITGSQVYTSAIEADLLNSDSEEKIQLDVAKEVVFILLIINLGHVKLQSL